MLIKSFYNSAKCDMNYTNARGYVTGCTVLHDTPFITQGVFFEAFSRRLNWSFRSSKLFQNSLFLVQLDIRMKRVFSKPFLIHILFAWAVLLPGAVLLVVQTTQFSYNERNIVIFAKKGHFQYLETFERAHFPSFNSYLSLTKLIFALTSCSTFAAKHFAQ